MRGLAPPAPPLPLQGSVGGRPRGELPLRPPPLPQPRERLVTSPDALASVGLRPSRHWSGLRLSALCPTERLFYVSSRGDRHSDWGPTDSMERRSGELAQSGRGRVSVSTPTTLSPNGQCVAKRSARHDRDPGRFWPVDTMAASFTHAPTRPGIGVPSPFGDGVARYHGHSRPRQKTPRPPRFATSPATQRGIPRGG